MAYSVLRSVGGATWYVARTLNPLRLYQASASTRLLVAGSILGLGTAGGVATVVIPKKGDDKSPSEAVVALADTKAFPGKDRSNPPPVKPLPDSSDDAPIGPPPTSLFGDRDRSASRSINRGQSPSPQDFGGNGEPSFSPRTKILNVSGGPIQQVADHSPVDSHPVEPGPVAVSIGDSSPHSLTPVPPSNFVEPTSGNEFVPNNASPQDQSPSQEIPPPKPQLRNLSEGAGNLRAPPELGPPPGNPPGNPLGNFAPREFGAPRENAIPRDAGLKDNGANNRFSTPPPNSFSPNSFPTNSNPPSGFSPEPANNPPPSVPDTGFGGLRSKATLGLGGGAAGAAGGAIGLPSEMVLLASPAPGAKQLEGLQTPSLAMEKVAPQDVQVGKPAIFQTKVRNVGQVVAHQVVVMDHVPTGARFAEATPQPQQTPDGMLLWKIGTLQPGEESVITMQVVPEREGEIGSVAQVLFQTQASVRAVCTKPQLVIKHTAPQKALIGDAVMLQISLTNNGTGAATGIVLSENVPPQLSHPAGTELEYEIGSLRPGETKQVTLALKAAKPGMARNLIVAGNDSNVSAQDEIQIEIVAPQLEVAINGPRVRYLERQATYNVILTNPGTAAAHNVELVTFLPRGFKFLSADKNGQYDSQNHAVFWSLEQLPPGVNGEVQVTALPVEIGEQKFRVETRADLGLQKVFEQAVQVEGLSELQFSVADVADPIEVGSDTVYEIKLTNRGHKPATNVQLAVAFPAELQPTSGDGPSRVVVAGNQLQIEPLARLAPGAQALYKIQARGLRDGDPRIRVQLMSDESPNPVTKEESTRVYADK